MKKLSITLRVTLWYTLFMALLAAVALGFLFHAAAQSAREGKRTLMHSMVADSSAAILGKVNGPTHMEAKARARASKMPDTR